MPHRLTDNARNAAKVNNHAVSAASGMHELLMGAAESKQVSLADVLDVLYTSATMLVLITDALRRFYSTEKLEPGNNPEQALKLLDQMIAAADLMPHGEPWSDRRTYNALMELKNKMTGQAGKNDESDDWARVQ